MPTYHFTVEHENKVIRGTFSLMENVGSYSHTFQILINKYFVGNLKCDGLNWRFETGKYHGIFPGLADAIGNYIQLWYDGISRN